MRIITLGLLFVAGSLLAQPKVPYINNSSIAFSVPMKDLMAEGITYDPVENAFYFSSARKGVIYKYAGGKMSVFADRTSGMWMVLDLKIDPKRRVLWATSSGGKYLRGYNQRDQTDGRPAGVFEFDLETGRLLRRATLDEPEQVHYLGNLEVLDNGNIYVTHMFEESRWFYMEVGSNRLQYIPISQSIQYPTGVTVSDDGQYIYVAHRGGIGRMQIATKRWTLVSNEENAKNLNGLYYYKNSLIGINSGSQMVVKFNLDEFQNEAVTSRILEKNHPMMMRPGMGVIIDDVFYYVANSQRSSLASDGLLYKDDQLFDLVILKIDLNEFE